MPSDDIWMNYNSTEYNNSICVQKIIIKINIEYSFFDKGASQ